MQNSKVKTKTQKSKISIVIPTYNRGDSLVVVLDSLKGQTYKEFEVIICDGGSKDRTKEVVQEYQKFFPLTFLENCNPLVTARNRGWQAASAEVVMFTDDDAKLDKNCLTEIVKIFKTDKKVGGVTGPSIIPQKRLANRDLFAFQSKKGFLWSVIRRIYEGYFLEGKPNAVGKLVRCGTFTPGATYQEATKIEKPFEVDYLETTNTSYRREILEKTGGFSTKYLGIGDWSEPDLAIRVRKLGYKLIFNPHAIVYHLVSRGGIYIRRNEAHQRMLNFVYYYKKNFAPFTPDKITRFITYLMFLNAFWFYKFLQTRNIYTLGSVTGTFAGFFR